MFPINIEAQTEQSKFVQSARIGSSYTYIWDWVELGLGDKTLYQEFTWNTNIAVELFPRTHFGFAYLNIHTIGNRNGRERNQYDLFSIFSQYDILVRNHIRVFAEGIYSYGNFCTCGREDPYKVDGLHYWGLGGGIELPIYKRLKLDLAFNSNNIFNDIDRKYNFTQYVIGLNYVLGKQSK